ncbi:hypothetical protein TRIUR3_33734 [Triticum urartu]|uniref:Uncharacterized protein n=1 Tax=Triticum urartu TaxID=4572 RepID=M7ZYI3_TRIUA|nr:hypothetical protein TRIUR3_33734 [Triticum urartu]
MERWTGVVHVPLSQGAPLFRVAASLILAPSKALARLSDAAYLAKLLAGKLAGEANAWVVDASCFAGPFAVYRELVPSVDTVGDPERYDPTGLPAAAGVATILAHCIREVSTANCSNSLVHLCSTSFLLLLLRQAPVFDPETNMKDNHSRIARPFVMKPSQIMQFPNTPHDPCNSNSSYPTFASTKSLKPGIQIQNKVMKGSLNDSAGNQEPTASLLPSSAPKTIILGFSKGGVVVNQLVSELSYWASKSAKGSVDVSRRSPALLTGYLLVPATPSDVLSSISEFHYLDVGLNCAGAYTTDHAVIKGIANYVSQTSDTLRFVLHGTPRQWSDPNRPWILAEKNTMLRLLQDEAKKCEGRLNLSEKKYFDGRPRSLLMHFEILEAMDIC